MLFNLVQTAERLGISQTSVKRLVESGALPAVPFGRPDATRKSLRFDESAVREFKKRTAQVPLNGDITPITPKDPPAGFITYKQAAVLLGWKYQRVCDQVKTGRLTSTTIGKRKYLSDSVISAAKNLPTKGWTGMSGSSPVVDVSYGRGGGGGGNNGDSTHNSSFKPDTDRPLKYIGTRLVAIEDRQIQIQNAFDTLKDELRTMFGKLDDLIKVWS